MFKLFPTLMSGSSYLLYIPIWLCSNVEKCIHIYKHIRLYIPIWLCSNREWYNRPWNKVLLYIPIWLCSNSAPLGTDRTFSVFTFQSGYVQMSLINRKCWAVASLHSNLVMFKLLSSQDAQYLLYLYIPIWLCSNTALFSFFIIKIFLYIPIWLCSNGQVATNLSHHKNLYIPIWLCSNFNS